MKIEVSGVFSVFLSMVKIRSGPRETTLNEYLKSVGHLTSITPVGCFGDLVPYVKFIELQTRTSAPESLRECYRPGGSLRNYEANGF